MLLVALTEVYTPQRSGLRERRKASSTFLEDPTITDKWLSEESVELWQIKYLDERLVELLNYFVQLMNVVVVQMCVHVFFYVKC